MYSSLKYKDKIFCTLEYFSNESSENFNFAFVYAEIKWSENWITKITIKRKNRAQYLWTSRQSVVPDDAPRDFGPEVAFGAKFQIPIARQGGREMSAPRPYETNPFHQLGSILT